jgi:signal transduction histidine kinase
MEQTASADKSEVNRLRKRSSLTARIVLIVFLGTGIPTGLFTSWITRQQIDHLEAEHLRTLKDISQKTTAAIAKSVWDMALDDSLPVLRAATDNSAVSAIDIISPDGPTLLTVGSPGSSVLERQTPIDGPILFDGQSIGTLRLWPDHAPLRATLRDLWFQSLAHAIGVVLATLILTWLMIEKALLRPLRRLHRDAQALSEMKLETSFDWRGTTEIGAVGHSLNEARERLRASIEDLNQKVEQRTQQVVEAERHSALSMMAAGMAHEINNPIAIIAGQAQRIRRQMSRGGSPDPAILTDAIDKIESTVERVSKITKSLRTYSRDGSHDPFEPTDLRSIVKDSESLLGQRLKTHSVGWETELPESPVLVQARVVELGQVMINLIGNALDAVESGPAQERRWIRVRLDQNNGLARLEVVDSGPGIPPEVRERLMTPFFTTKPIGKGTGLGLSISRTIIESHGGTLSLAPDSPNTCFVITLPLSAASSPPGQSQAS